MWWAEAPRHTNSYKTYASSSPTRSGGHTQTQASSYVPGGLVYIHVRATEQNKKYRGLLLYALDNNKKKVGSWELADEVTPALNYHQRTVPD